MDRRGFMLGAGLALPALAALPSYAWAAGDAVLREVIESGHAPRPTRPATSGAIPRPRCCSGA